MDSGEVRKVLMPTARYSLLCLIAIFGAISSAFAQSSPHQLEILLEKNAETGWRTAEPGEILDQGNEVRFRLTSNVDGRIYAYSRAPDGKTRLIFPSAGSQAGNRLTSGREFLLPEDGSFAIDGPAGHEIIYWVISPEDNRAPPAQISQLLRPIGPTPPRLTPSCDDTVLRARGSCVDATAGAQQFSLPKSSTTPDGLRARSIAITKDLRSSVITAPRSRDGFIIFEYRIAHR